MPHGYATGLIRDLLLIAVLIALILGGAALYTFSPILAGMCGGILLASILIGAILALHPDQQDLRIFTRDIEHGIRWYFSSRWD